MASLIKVSGGKVPHRAIQFVNAAGERKTIRIGRCGLEQGRTFQQNVERLLACNTLGTAPDLQLATWIAERPDDVHDKLSAVGLVTPRQPKSTVPTLHEWTEKYLEQRKPELKPSSVSKMEKATELLKSFLGAERIIDSVSISDAADWRAWLRTETRRSESTIRMYVRYAKLIFGAATARELIKANPFSGLPSRAAAAERTRHVDANQAAALLEGCSDPQWRTLVALCRYAGLRCPSETHRLRWGDVDWERMRLNVYAPKTERYEKHRRRLVPVVPALAKVLETAFSEAPEGQEQVVQISTNNMHRAMRGIVKRAKLSAIARPFQTLRQSCETELAMTFPQHAVSAWLGHSIAVSQEHYLTVPDELFDRAAGFGKDSAAKSAAVSSGIDSQGVENAPNATQSAAQENGVPGPAEAENADGPGGIRTPDQAIMSRLL